MDDILGAEVQDALTGLYNRSYFAQKIEELTTGGVKFSLVLLEVDNFEIFNNKYQRTGGDIALASIARTINANTGKDDLAARWGGDEFGICLKNVDNLDVAAQKAEVLRQAIEATRFHVDQDLVNCTVSVGVGVWDGQEKSVNVFDRVENSLFEAKNSDKRNTVVKSVH